MRKSHRRRRLVVRRQLARQWVERLSSRLENEKRELVLFLIELADFDAKKLALELGYPSTLGCLVTELRLSESSACRRISAARLLARFPQIAGYLLASRLTLMSLVALKEVLDDSNVDELLERASGLSEPEVRQLVLRLGAAPRSRSWHRLLQLPPPWRQIQSPPRCSYCETRESAARRAASGDAVGRPGISRGARGSARAAWPRRAERQEGRRAAPRSSRAAQSARATAIWQSQANEHSRRRKRQPGPTTFRRRCGARCTGAKAEPAPTSAKNSAAVARRCVWNISISFRWRRVGHRRRTTSRYSVARTICFRPGKISAKSTFGASGSNAPLRTRWYALAISEERRSR